MSEKRGINERKQMPPAKAEVKRRLDEEQGDMDADNRELKDADRGEDHG